MDETVLTISLFSFCFFLFTHLILLRYAAGLKTPAVMGGCALAGLVFLELILVKKLTSSLWLGSLTAAFIYFLLILLYLSLIYGMGEAAVRIRLLREIDSHPSRSATLVEILQSYNAEKMLGMRLERLLSAGHLRYDGQNYHLASRILLIQSLASRFLKFLLGIKLQ